MAQVPAKRRIPLPPSSTRIDAAFVHLVPVVGRVHDDRREGEPADLDRR